MKKAFTLVEVIISVFIFFVVVISIMNIISNNKHLITLLLDNKNFTLKASLAFLNPGKKNNYERVKEFNILNPKVIDILKKNNILIKTNKENINFSNTKIVIKKLTAYDKFHSTSIYSIGVK